MYLKDFFREYLQKNPRLQVWEACTHYFIWQKCIKKNLKPIDLKIPWINLGATNFLKQRLDKKSVVLEFGMGSTLFFASRCQNLVSIEHDKCWFHKVQKRMNNAKQKIKPFLCAIPRHRLIRKQKAKSALNNKKDFSTHNYAEIAKRFKDKSFDCILIDGIDREACLMACHSKIKIGGYLVLDDAERSEYSTSNAKKTLRHFEAVFDAWGPCPSLRHFTRCKIYVRKK